MVTPTRQTLQEVPTTSATGGRTRIFSYTDRWLAGSSAQIAARSVSASTRSRRVFSSDCRLGPGLEPLAPGEVQVIVMAVMGGVTIAGALGRSPEVAGSARLWILQPMQRLERLRDWLAAQGHGVERELSATDRRRVYTVLVVRPRAQ